MGLYGNEHFAKDGEVIKSYHQRRALLCSVTYIQAVEQCVYFFVS